MPAHEQTTDVPGAGRPDVAEAIREAIVRGDFAPNQRLVESDLSDMFGVGRSSVRAALFELTTEGLVERVQNRGARVRAVTVDEAIEISELRMVVEGLCAAKAAERVTDTEVAELRALGDAMRAAVAQGHVLEYSELNKALHSRIVEISGQRTAAGVLRRLRAQNVRHQFQLALVPGRPNVSVAEHLAIIDEICARAPDAAERAARRHLRSVIDALKAI
ncbi:FCD domain-containing protein [Actinomadura sp. LD22]|uniref:FCD domain-containing protein n=1 Tax=Actinomadura physcomitrii TaxID=2650748 RepID=A0A6I4MUB7_9ACTN|nr:GntR family transcriptional regulator [Actinomadura physcomitrii]MWA07527.1 FCD domain-containing protein [Actinomadura physcomitrii]